jgi:hypothetical protein
MRIVTKEELVFVGGGNAGDTVNGTFSGTTSPSDSSGQTSAGSSTSATDIIGAVGNAVVACVETTAQAITVTKNPKLLVAACIGGAASTFSRLLN